MIWGDHSAPALSPSGRGRKRGASRDLAAFRASQPQTEFDYSTSASADTGDFWFDYAADIGDGWNSTFAVADAIARPKLDVGEIDRCFCFQ